MASAEGYDDIVGKLISKGAKIDAVTSVRMMSHHVENDIYLLA
jgi:hypothetical protein